MSEKHPIQPLIVDSSGTVRYKENAIVSFLLDALPGGLNEIARQRGHKFSEEDYTQLMMLIGYSHSNASMIPDEVWAASMAMREEGKSEHEARADHLRDKLQEIRDGMREGAAALFGVHPDDLKGDDQ